MQSIGEMLFYVESLPLWASHLIASVLLVYTMVVMGIVIAKTGRGFAWALLVFVPYLGFIGLWVLALVSWPRGGQPQHHADPSTPGSPQ